MAQSQRSASRKGIVANETAQGSQGARMVARSLPSGNNVQRMQCSAWRILWTSAQHSLRQTCTVNRVALSSSHTMGCAAWVCAHESGAAVVAGLLNHPRPIFECRRVEEEAKIACHVASVPPLWSTLLLSTRQHCVTIGRVATVSASPAVGKRRIVPTVQYARLCCTMHTTVAYGWLDHSAWHAALGQCCLCACA